MSWMPSITTWPLTLLAPPSSAARSGCCGGCCMEGASDTSAAVSPGAWTRPSPPAAIVNEADHVTRSFRCIPASPCAGPGPDRSRDLTIGNDMHRSGSRTNAERWMIPQFAWIAAVLLVTILTAVLAPATAQAARRDHQRELYAALHIGRMVYPTVCQPVQVVEWTDESGPTVLAGGDPVSCTLHLSAGWRTPWRRTGPGSSVGPWDWWQLCAVIVHETGHLAGLGHSPDPRSPMFERSHPIPRICGRRAPSWTTSSNKKES